MKQLFSLFLLLFIVASCERKHTVSYPFLNDSMNELVTINRAELMALRYRSIANGKQMSYGLGGTFAPLYEDSVDVAYLASGVLLTLDINMSHWQGFESAASEPEAKRIKACQNVAWPNIAALAQFLQCDPALITTKWSCFSLKLQGEISGKEAVSMIASGRQAEHDGHVHPATRPESK